MEPAHKKRRRSARTDTANAIQWILDHKSAKGRPPGGGPVSEWGVDDTPGIGPDELRSVIHTLWHKYGGDPTLFLGSMYEDTGNYENEEDGDGNWWLYYPFEEDPCYTVVFVWPNSEGSGYFVDCHAKDPTHFVMRKD